MISLIHSQLESDAIENSLVRREGREAVVDGIFARWDGGESPDAAQVLQDYPELAGVHSVVLELACEEYWQRIRRGDAPSVAEFCDRFPGHSTALRRILAVQSALSRTPGEARIAWPRGGDVFRGFRLREQIGMGAFSRVFLADDLQLGERRVVVKLTTMPGNEPTALGKLQHQNIVPVLSFSHAAGDDLSMLVMPFLGTLTLESLLDRVRAETSIPRTSATMEGLLRSVDAATPSGGAQSFKLWKSTDAYVDAVLRMMRDLCLGLHEAHRLGFFHYDIKPSNILMASDGTLKFLDFNLTQYAGAPDAAKGGTLPYMSPEQLSVVRRLGDTCSLAQDGRSDIFSLGVVLYEVLTSVHPFGPFDLSTSVDSRAIALADRHRRGPTPIRSLDPTINSSLARLIESCLASEPGKRPSSAAELGACLSRELRPWRRSERIVRSRPRLSVAAVFGAVVVGLVGMSAARDSHVPTHSELARVEAASHLERGDCQSAINALTDALRREPRSAPALLMRAKAFRLSGGTADALADYRAAANLEPSRAASSGILYCLARLDRYPEAVEQGFEIASKSSCSASDLNNYAYCLIRLNRHQIARTYLDRAVILNPTSAAIRYNRALTERMSALTHRGRRPILALDDVRIAIELDANRGESYWLAAELALMISPGDAAAEDEALHWLREAVRCGAYAPTIVNSYAVFSPLRKYPEFQELLHYPADKRHRFSAQKLIAPIE